MRLEMRLMRLFSVRGVLLRGRVSGFVFKI